MSLVLDGSNGMTAPVGAVYNGLQTATAQASTSGTSITFSSIPSWVKRISVILSGVTKSAGNDLLIQLATSGGTVATGYVSYGVQNTGAGGIASSATTGFNVKWQNSGAVVSGKMELDLITGTTWTQSHTMAATTSVGMYAGGGTIALGATLTGIVITTTSTDTFSAGTINIIYE
jgi:hypothetical protein